MLVVLNTLPNYIKQQCSFANNELCVFEDYNYYVLLEDIQLALITIGIDYSYRSCILGVPLIDKYIVIVR